MNSKVFGGVTLLVIAVAALTLISRGYGEISENAYQLATATYGACLAESIDRLERVESLLDDDVFTSRMSGKEVRWFKSIFKKARNDDWTRAAQLAKRMMKDQVVY